jgi:hypothetical protein
MSSPDSENATPETASVPEPDGEDQPSNYLRSRCPLCFGGKDWKKKDELCVIHLLF